MKKIIYWFTLLLFYTFFTPMVGANQNPTASQISSVTSAFSKCLGVTDNNVQTSLNDIDVCLGHTISGVNWNQIGGLQTAVNASGFNWQSLLGINTSNINWQNIDFTNVKTIDGINPASWLAAVLHDASLIGAGTVSSNLGINWQDLTIANATGINWTGFYPTSNPFNYLASVTANSPLSGLGTVGSPLVFTNPGYITNVGIGTANNISYWVDSSHIGALNTSTYPSLTELSYSKGVTSAIQTQLNTKGTGNGTVTQVSVTAPLTGGTFTTSGSVGINTTLPWNGIPAGIVAVSPITFSPTTGNVGITTTGTWNGNAVTSTTASTVTTNANLNGPITSSGNTTSINAQTGTGSTFVMQAGSPNFTGNVGIGSTNPGTALDVQGTIRGLGIILPNGAQGQVIMQNSVGVGTWSTVSASGGTGTVTQVNTVAPLIGTITTSGTIGIGTATASNDGYLTHGDWNTFNGKQASGAYLTTVTADSPLSGSGTSGSHLVFTNPGYITTAVTSITALSPLTGGTITTTGNIGISSTGTGTVIVLQNTPTLTTPVIGAATGTSLALTGNIGIGGANLTTNPLQVTGAAEVTGNLGIGTAVAPNNLYVAGTGQITGATTLSSTLSVTGNVGIGTVTAPYALYIVGTQQNTTGMISGNIGIGTAVVPSQLFEVVGTGNVGVGTFNPGEALDVNGGIRFNGNLRGGATGNVGIGTFTTGAGATCDSSCNTNNQRCLFGLKTVTTGIEPCSVSIVGDCVCLKQ